jgi:hypothetical protein
MHSGHVNTTAAGRSGCGAAVCVVCAWSRGVPSLCVEVASAVAVCLRRKEKRGQKATLPHPSLVDMYLLLVGVVVLGILSRSASCECTRQHLLSRQLSDAYGTCGVCCGFVHSVHSCLWWSLLLSLRSIILLLVQSLQPSSCHVLCEHVPTSCIVDGGLRLGLLLKIQLCHAQRGACRCLAQQC